ncbi:serine/arginine repetitive matrix protein 1-like [Gopherus flavomarginatus]|uniref:serine/arginine repetitive matrix protein 1-like n=1 Tax=Gopherus flavomarginatus TaxID=286002 RepID=UPI0021CC4682|nr:serine/arginine repetitive matrix protein 1-like [Gopherus flavomarginatus]
MPGSPRFKLCKDCGKFMPKSDLHSACLRCLGESHQKDQCSICRGFRPRTLKDRTQRLRVLLMEAALQPPSEPAEAVPSTSSLVRSAWAWASGLRAQPKSSKSRHRMESGPRKSASVWHRSPSPVPTKKREPVRERSPHQDSRPMPSAGASRQAGLQPSAAPSTPAPQRGRSSPDRPRSPDLSGDLRLLSTPEAFEAASDLMGLPVPASLHRRELRTAARPPVQWRGKPAMLSPPSPLRAAKVAPDQIRGSPPPQHRSPTAPGAASPNSLYSETSDSEADTYRSNRSRSRRSVSEASHQHYPQWQQQWHPPSQWPFWTP